MFLFFIRKQPIYLTIAGRSMIQGEYGEIYYPGIDHHQTCVTVCPL